MARLTITSTHPVRAAIADLDNYHESKGAMLRAVYEALAAHDIRMEDAVIAGPDGYTVLRLYPVPAENVVCECCAARADSAEFVNGIMIAWYTMGSGRIELTAYVT